MISCSLTRFAFGALCGALLAGCSAAGSQSAGGAIPGAPQQQASDAALARILRLATPTREVPAYRPNHRKSWILPDAPRRQYLLYVSDAGSGTVNIYNYRARAGRMFGQITGFAFPLGQCIDRSGNVYVVDAGTNTVYEFAHGGITPIATASDDFGSPSGCSVDRTTGNVAVGNLYGVGSDPAGGVVIYAGGLSGTQTNYTDPNLINAFPPGYDPSGNLYVQGLGSYGEPTFVEMPVGSSSFSALTGLGDRYPGSVQWDGSYITATDQAYHGNRTSIDRVTVSGSAVTVVRTTVLEDDHHPGNLMTAMQPFINGTTRGLNAVVAGNEARFFAVNFWNYANGGEPKRSLPEDIAPVDATGQSVSPLRNRHG